MIWKEKMIKKCLILIVFFLLSVDSPANAAMQSQNYQIGWDSLNSGGLDNSTSTNYRLLDTIGQSVSGFGTSESYELSAGYRTPGAEGAELSFTVEAALESSKTSFTIFDDPGYTVTVSSAAGFNEEDYIVVVEDEGAAQLIAFGKIASISGNDLTVDEWAGQNTIMSLNAGGGDDFVYKLSGNAIGLGTLSLKTVETGVSFFEVNSNVGTGYTVYVKENQDLSDGSEIIADVNDGTVTAGSEEYGIETVGTYAVGSGDFAITTAKQTVAYKAGLGQADRTGIIYKAGIDINSQEGNYAQTVSYYVTVNY